MVLVRVSGDAPQKLGRNRGDLPYTAKSSEAKVEIPDKYSCAARSFIGRFSGGHRG
jgi:hypothetical protein